MSTEALTIVSPSLDKIWAKREKYLTRAKKAGACQEPLNQAKEAQTPDELEAIIVENINWIAQKGLLKKPIKLSNNSLWGGTATAGHLGMATAGNLGTASAGDSGTATAGDEGMAIAGKNGKAFAGYRGTATAGDWGTAMVGYWGKASAGDDGTASAGHGGTASAGGYGIISIWYYDGNRNRLKTGYIGEDGLEPNIPYKLNENNNFIKAD